MFDPKHWAEDEEDFILESKHQRSPEQRFNEEENVSLEIRTKFKMAENTLWPALEDSCKAAWVNLQRSNHLLPQHDAAMSAFTKIYEAQIQHLVKK